MPRIAVYKFLVFYMVSFDITEPPHLHVRRNHKTFVPAKIWLESCEFSPTQLGDFSKEELNLIQKLVIKNQKSLLNSFNQVVNSKKPKLLTLKLK